MFNIMSLRHHWTKNFSIPALFMDRECKCICPSLSFCFCMYDDLRQNVAVQFVDVVSLVDHHY
jgi:hypothetical protein